ncbi:metal transporter [Marinomonas piezotolerans]|uniref:Metal transporter n=1 Tax=Marinomonas piezotolerans TaxID=2213058 RepID=A0A370U665_9GAMM|nr:potassium channel family protein [Marinomonas piezotolerans]RDL43264.1 metal transporter [Marinomonas piezotolerans]
MVLAKFMTRRVRSRQRFRKQVHLHAMKDLRRRFTLLAVVVALHSIAMVYFEDLDWWQAFWLTMTSASTTGYGDISAATFWGQFTTIVLIYGMGITLLAQIASDYVELRLMRKEMKLKGRMEWSDMQDHLLIINTPTTNTERYLDLLVQQVCNTPELSDVPIQLLTPKFPEGLPESLRSKGVVHHTGDATTSGMLSTASIGSAKYIVVLSPDSLDPHSDSLVFDILHRIKETGSDAFILAEAIDDNNRERFRAAGAKAVIRPIRAYPEMLVRSLIAPGTEQVLEDLFRYQGDHTVRINVILKHVRWSDIVTTLIQKGIGTAIGYEDPTGKIVTHPASQNRVDINALIVLVGEEQKTPAPLEIQKLFAEH